MLVEFSAAATTCEIAPGEEQVDDAGIMHVRRRIFTDVVESEDPRIAGQNQPTLDIDLDPAKGSGTLHGRFTLTPKSGAGTWEGELTGQIEKGLVSASGIAAGTGSFSGEVLRVDFWQVEKLATPPPCPAPKAFFEMRGLILRR